MASAPKAGLTVTPILQVRNQGLCRVKSTCPLTQSQEWWSQDVSGFETASLTTVPPSSPVGVVFSERLARGNCSVNDNYDHC